MREVDTQFPRSWQLQALEDCMSAIIDYRGKSPQKTPFGIPLVTAKVVKAGRIIAPDEFIAVEDYDKWMRRGIPQPGDVVMTTEAPLGEVAQLDDRKVALAQRLITLRGKPGVLDNTFLKFVMQSQFVQDELKARATGTTVLGVRQSELRRILLPLPPIEEQKRIVEILGALDEKIQLNQRMNETLEAIARAIFKSWFVDLDPISATAKSFKNGLPAGWQWQPLSAICQVNSCQLRDVEPDYELKYIDISSAKRGQILQTQLLRFVDAPSRARRRVLDGDTVISTVRPGNRAFFFVVDPPDNLVVSTGYAVLTPKANARALTYLGVTCDETIEHLDQIADGGAYPAIRPEQIGDVEIAWPGDKLANTFEGLVRPLLLRIAANARESRMLADTRDALLPKLMSGEVRLKHLEKMVETHA